MSRAVRTVSVRVAAAGASRTADREALLAFVAEVTRSDPALVRVRRRCPHCGAVDHGRPDALVDGRPVGVGLARTSGVLVLAVGPGRIGVDVERPSRVTAAPLDAFTAGERDRAAAGPDGVGLQLAACWAVKEAVLKRDGRGLRVEPVRVEAVLGRTVRETVRGGHARFDGVDHPVTVVVLDADLVLAVAAGGAAVRVQDLRARDRSVVSPRRAGLSERPGPYRPREAGLRGTRARRAPDAPRAPGA
ncbi:4'-phosphopantetheinyl transferase superfamily protein [Curtobacterium sp. MCBD17_021]|uniref:4'-phosphopantetheinyl transferase family protein n=1 Tax=Curtobacterium sp. MCBD17_021 TaxID=2175665 RepID=UPI0015E8CECC|nr:4'-phosphopantetheinyl transferase superfamily protein [Curtobacterium sp. MCBD17_021]